MFEFRLDRFPVFNALVENPDEERMNKEFSRQAKQMQEMSPLMQEAQMNALGNTMSVFAPYNNMLGMMGGADAMIPLSQALENPMPPMPVPQGPQVPPQMQGGSPVIGSDTRIPVTDSVEPADPNNPVTSLNYKPAAGQQR